MINNKYGSWLVLEKDPSKQKDRNIRYICKCNCGTIRSVDASRLRLGKTTSCGCSRQTEIFRQNVSSRITKDAEHSALTKYWHLKKTNATHRKISFSLTKEEFKTLVKQPCYYCGTSNSNFVDVSLQNTKRILYFNGIDRVDSSKGYINSNCVPCCKHCNAAKGELSINEFKEHIQKLIPFATN